MTNKKQLFPNIFCLIIEINFEKNISNQFILIILLMVKQITHE